MTRSWSRTIPVLLAAAFSACASQQPTPGGGPSTADWRSLFDGKTTAGWREYKGQTVPDGWFVRDGALTKTAGVRDIISVDQFGDFELELEWKIERGGNAGLFYRATEEYDRVYWSAAEYQLLDDPNARDGRSRLTSAGSVYGLYPAPEGHLKPAGEWNTTRIVAKGAHAEHWLNGTKLAEYEYGSPDWEAKVKASKFNEWPNYGRSRRGHIAIQGDHNGELQLRSIRIREIK
ncbi:MAG: DUF1080 domain-containing protein [Gemmatimonadota bacterium]